jgi:hypothetical protein
VASLLRRYTTRQVLVAAATSLALGLPLIGFVANAAALMAVLSMLGLLDVFNDMSMNAQGVIAQDGLGRQIMNRLHGMWSLGFVVGSTLGLGASAVELDLRAHLAMISVLLLITIWWVRGRLATDDPPSTPPPRLGQRAGPGCRPPW